MLEDGLPDFYSKRVLPDSQLSSLHQGQSLRRKKRRSVLSIFSGFRKNRNSTISNQDSDASENVYSMIQHPKEAVRPESAGPGANGAMPSPRPLGVQGVPVHGMRAASPSCLIQRQSTDLVSMVYSCIGAEIEDSDGSSTCDIKDGDQDADGSTAVSDAPPDARTNGHVASKQQPDRQERIVPLSDPRAELEEEDQERGNGGPAAPCGTKPEPPPQSAKPSLTAMRQRHLQESLEEAGRLQGEEEERRRARGPEGQRPLPPNKPGLDLSRDKTSPEKAVTSPRSSPVAPGEVAAGDTRSFPPAQPPAQPPSQPPSQPVIHEEGGSEGGGSSPPTARPGGEATLPTSQDDEGRNGFPAASHHTRKSNSFDIGMERDSPYDLERSSDPRFPLKHPRFPQYRNRSLDCPAGTRCYDSPQLGSRDVL